MVTSKTTGPLLELTKRRAVPIEGNDIDCIAPELSRAQLVLLGEASHGTHDFYRLRAAITKRLIEKEGFSAVAIEADWPDTHRVDRYLRGLGDDADAERALGGFQHFPTWMWRNADILDFVGWLREYNDQPAPGRAKIGFYGLDLYSLHGSMTAVIEYLRKIDPEAAEQARRRYACFDRFGGNGQSYGYAAASGFWRSCEGAVVAQLKEMQRRRFEELPSDEALFYAEQNARVVKSAEAYYRVMVSEEASSWNLRDQHMAQTLDRLVEYLTRRGREPKIVVWAHNSHLGDARFTEAARIGEWNVGELVRRQYGDRAFLLGFTTDHGTVTAASRWDAPPERMRVRPALADSFERIFHLSEIPRFLLRFRGDDVLQQAFSGPRLERAIGVVYRPERERASHYFRARLGRQFDAVIHLDHTRAVEPLERTTNWDEGEVPETYPSAL